MKSDIYQRFPYWPILKVFDAWSYRHKISSHLKLSNSTRYVSTFKLQSFSKGGRLIGAHCLWHVCDYVFVCFRFVTFKLKRSCMRSRTQQWVHALFPHFFLTLSTHCDNFLSFVLICLLVCFWFVTFLKEIHVLFPDSFLTLSIASYSHIVTNFFHLPLLFVCLPISTWTSFSQET